MKMINGKKMLSLYEFLEMATDGTQEDYKKCKACMREYCHILEQKGYGTEFTNYAEFSAQQNTDERHAWLQHTFSYVEHDQQATAHQLFEALRLKMVWED